MDATEHHANYILIIDDSPLNLQYLQRLLTRSGYQVEIADSGKLGLETAIKTIPDLIILDIMMPEMDGYEVCQHLKADERTQSIPIIFVSVVEAVSEKVRAFQAGGADYVTKPFQQDELLARIQHQLTILTLHRQLQVQNAQLKAEIKIRQQLEEKFAKAFLSSPHPISLVNRADGRFLDINLSFLKTFGYEKSEIINLTASELNLWVNAEEEQRFHQQLAQEITVNNWIVEHRTKQGEIKTVLLSAELIEFDQKICILSILNDITEQQAAQRERQKIEAALRDSEKKYRNLVETSQDIILTVDQHGYYTFVNAAVKSILGYEPEDVIGQLFSQFIAADQDAKIEQIFQMIVSGKSVVQQQVIHRSASGRLVHLMINASPLYNSEGEWIGMTGTASDITEQKASERALQLIVEGTAAKTGQEFFRSCVYYLAEVLEVRYAGVYQFFPSPESQLTTLTFWDGNEWHEPLSYPLLETPFQSVVQTKKAYYFQENIQKLFPKDRNLVALNVESYWGVPLLDSDGEVIGILTVMDTKPMQLSVTQESILKIFAARAGAELERKLAEEFLEYRSAMDSRLSSISRMFIDQDLDTAINYSLQEVGQFIDCDFTFIFHFHSHQKQWHITHQWQSPELATRPINPSIFSQAHFPWIHQQLQAKRDEILTIFLSEEQPEHRIQDQTTLRNFGYQSLLFIPLMQSGQTKGFMGLINPDLRCKDTRSCVCTPEIIVWLKLIGELIAIRLTAQETQQALQRTHARYQNLAENVPGMIYQLLLLPDGSMNLPYVSLGCWDLYGISPEEAMENAQVLFERIYPDDLTGVLDTIDYSARTLLPWNYTWRIIDIQGEIRWLQGNARPELQPNGSILWDGLLIDITQDKQAETFLRETAQRQQTLAGIIGRMRQTLDAETIFSTTTTELREALNCDRVAIYQFDSDWSGAFVAESVVPGWKPLVNSSTGNWYFPAHAILDQDCVLYNLSQGDRIQDTYWRDNQQGVYRDGMSYLCIPDVYQAGLPDAYVQMLEQIQAKAYIIVPIFCQTVLESSIAKPQTEKTSPQSRLKLWGLLAIYQNSAPRQWQDFEINLAVQIGAQLGVAVQQVALLTHTQQQSQELKMAKDAADAANRAKSKFLANMSHELRTPLNAILGFTQLMSRERTLSQEQQENIKIIHRSGKYLLALINDILEMSKQEVTNQEIGLSKRSVELLPWLEGLYELLNSKALSRGIRLGFQRSADLPATIQTDEHKLREILLNILGNLIELTPTGEICVAVKLRPMDCSDLEDDETIWLRFEIENNGINLETLNINRLFEPFTPIQRSFHWEDPQNLTQGISQEFLQLMGGAIALETVGQEPPKLTVKIPVQVVATESLLTAKTSGTMIGLSADHSQYRILVVEDQIAQRFQLRQWLKSQGFEVEEAENGRVGLGIWQRRRPDLILMKMRLPVLSGYEATQTIRQTQSQQQTSMEIAVENTFESQLRLENRVPIIALISSNEAEEKQLALSVGCDDFLSPPVQEEELLYKISQYLEVQLQPQPSLPLTPLAVESPDYSLSPVSLTATTLTVMSPEWLRQLYNAAAQCSDQLLFQLIGQIPEEQVALTQVLTHLVNNFRFDQVMELVKRSEDSVQKTQ